MSGASFHRGASAQDYSTPDEFMSAVVERFGARLTWDLAASAENAKAPLFFTEADDALTQVWTSCAGDLWLNPPFSSIAPWAKKCADSLHYLKGRIFFLTPASVGSDWFAKHVNGRALVHMLSPRLSFDGKNPYPKDCILSVYGAEPGYVCWRWRR